LGSSRTSRSRSPTSRRWSASTACLHFLPATHAADGLARRGIPLDDRIGERGRVTRPHVVGLLVAEVSTDTDSRPASRFFRPTASTRFRCSITGPAVRSGSSTTSTSSPPGRQPPLGAAVRADPDTAPHARSARSRDSGQRIRWPLITTFDEPRAAGLLGLRVSVCYSAVRQTSAVRGRGQRAAPGELAVVDWQSRRALYGARPGMTGMSRRA
jgi:hypothetical protein